MQVKQLNRFEVNDACERVLQLRLSRILRKKRQELGIDEAKVYKPCPICGTPYLRTCRGCRFTDRAKWIKRKKIKQDILDSILKSYQEKETAEGPH